MAQQNFSKKKKKIEEIRSVVKNVVMSLTKVFY